MVKWREEAGLSEQRARQQEQRHDLVGGQEQEKLGELRDEVRPPASLSPRLDFPAQLDATSTMKTAFVLATTTNHLTAPLPNSLA